MADTLPIDTDSVARTELNPIARLDAPTTVVVLAGLALQAFEENPDPVAAALLMADLPVMATYNRHAVCDAAEDAMRLGNTNAAYVLDALYEELYRRGIRAEAKHALLDLDSDSACPFSGATSYPYLTTPKAVA